MALILNTILPDNKKCVFALNKIYGLGNNLAKQICEQLGISFSIKCKNLNNNQLDRLIQCISQNYLTGDHLKEKIGKNKQHLISINSYKGFRYIERLPCRGQRTHGNAQTARKNRASSATRFISNSLLIKKNKNYPRNSKKTK
jgi:small subunit ribosomal protein S13